MQYLNLETRFLHAEEYIGCEPRARGTWLSAMLWCAQQENGGRIAGAAAWRSRRFEQTFGATRREIDAAAPLLTWNGDDLVVWGYPHAQQEKYLAAAERARVNGRAGGRPPSAPPSNEEPTSKPTSVPKSEPTSQSVREGKGTEGNEIPLAGLLPFPGTSSANSESARPAKPARSRDVLFEALARAEGSDPLQLTKAGARAIGVALAEIRRASPEVTVSEIQNRAAIYRKVMSHGCTLTAAALAKHWARCSGAPVGKVANEKPAPVPSGWVAWLDENMPASDDIAWSQLTAAKNLQSFTLMPVSWQDRCRAELQQSEPALAPRASKHFIRGRCGAALPAEVNRF